jgi:hypothetical protein
MGALVYNSNKLMSYRSFEAGVTASDLEIGIADA